MRGLSYVQPRRGRGTRSGAIVEVVWPRTSVSPEADPESPGLGENRPIVA